MCGLTFEVMPNSSINPMSVPRPTPIGNSVYIAARAPGTPVFVRSGSELTVSRRQTAGPDLRAQRKKLARFRTLRARSSDVEGRPGVARTWPAGLEIAKNRHHNAHSAPWTIRNDDDSGAFRAERLCRGRLIPRAAPGEALANVDLFKVCVSEEAYDDQSVI